MVSQPPRASVSLHHRPFHAPGRHGPARLQGTVPGKPMFPRGAHQPGVPRETPLVLTAVPRYSGERPFPGGGHRPTAVPPLLSHRAGPPRPPDTDSIRMDTEQHEGRRGAGRERAAGSGGERLGGRGDGSPGLSASSAGLCLACTGDWGGCSAGPLPRSPALGGAGSGLFPRRCRRARLSERGGTAPTRRVPSIPGGAQTCVCIRLCRGRLGSEFWEDDWEWWEEDAEALLALSNCT